MRIEIDDGRLVITLGIDRLPGLDEAPQGGSTPIDARRREDFARNLAAELRRPRADGRTPVHHLLEALASDVADRPRRREAASRPAPWPARRAPVDGSPDDENPVRGIRNGVLISALLSLVLLVAGWLAIR